MNPIKRQQQEKQQQQSPPKQQQQQLQSKYVITNRKSEIGNFGGSGSLSELESSSTKTIIKPTTISSNLIVQTINGARRLSISSKPIDKSIIGINSKKLLYDNSNSKAGILNTTKQQLTPSSQSQSHHKQINTNKMKVMPLTGINNTVIPIIMTNVNQINVDNSTNVKTYQAGANKKSAMIAISTTPKLHSYRTTSSTAAAGAATVTSTTAITTTITATTPTPTSSNSIGESVALNKLLISSTASINNANIKNNPNNNNTNNSSSNNSNNNNNNNVLVTTADQAVPSTSIIIRNQTAATHIKIQQQQQNQQHICKNNAAGVGVKEVHEESNNTMISSPHTTLLKTSLTQSGKQGQKQQQGQLQTKPQQQEQLQAQQSQQQPQQKQLPETIILNSNFKSKNKDGYLGKIVITRQQTLLQQQQHKEQKQQQHQESVIKPQQQQQQIKNNIEESKSKGQVLLNVNSKNLLNGLQSKIVTSATVTKAVTAAATAAAIATSNSVKLTASTANKVSIVPNLNKITNKMITTTTTNSTSTITTASSNQNHHISLLQLQQQQQQPINKNDSANMKASGNGNAIVETNSLLKNNNDMIVSITNGHGHNTSNDSSNGNGNNNGTIKLEKSNDNSLLLKSNTSVNQNKNKDAPLNSDATNILNTTNKRLDFIQNFQQIRSEISLLKPLKNNHAAANINANNNIKEEVSLLKISNCKVTNVVENAMRNGGIKEINNHNNGNNNKKRESLLKAAPVTITTAAATASAATVPTTIEKSKILQMNKMPFSEPSPSVVKSNGSHFQRSQSLNSTEQQSDVNGERRNSEPLNNNNDKMNDIHFQHDKQPEMHEIFKVLKSKKEIEFNKNDIKNNNIETLIISVNETPITITTNTTAMTTTTVTAKNSTLSSVNCSKKIQSNVDDKNLHRNVKLHKNTNNVNHHDTNGVHGSGNDNDDDDDDDVTILPTQEQTEPIEIIDDDDEDENVNGYYNNSNDAKGFMTYKTKNSNEENVKNKSINNNLSLLCEEQVFMSSSSSGISNNSTEIMTTPTIIAKSTSVSSALVTKPSLRSPTSSLSPPLTVKVEKNPLPPVINNNSTPLLKKTLTESKLSGLMGSNDTSYSSVLDALSNFNMLSWRERVGTARSTNLKFQLNEFNLVQVHERCPPRLRIHTAYEKPINDRQITRQNQNQSSNVNYPDEAPLLYQCRRCRSYGPAVDFLAPEFCSLHCLKRDSQKRHREDNLRDNPRKRSKRTDVVSVPLLESTGPKFRWNSYLQDNQNAISAPISLFLNPFPTGPNNFKVGMKLEAIDPDNCSLFCVCTVIETNGYRLKLTFDGYDSAYDFWVNADSMDIFPPGWCCKTNHVLQPPKGISYNRFNWTVYLNKERATAAPRSLFTHLNASSLTSRNPFKIGMHLEAEDLNDTGKLCVATVADVLGDRIRIHFDGWDECYDIIVDINSPYIHPCGWHEGRQQLVVPPECENSSFNWPDYIRKHGGSVAASEELFESREPINFRPQMKLEVVDPRNPSLIRPATVMAHKGHRAKLHLDGWPADYCFWLEDDSPDLHPIGWCETTGHDLEPPPGFRMSEKKMPCPIVGCRGIGNTRKPSMSVHANRDCCPYAPENWRIVLERPLRLSYEEIVHPLPTAHETAKPTQLSGEKGNQNRLSNREILERLQIIDSIKPHHGPFAPKDNATISVPNDFIGFSKLSTTNVITTSNNAINTTIITTNSAILTTTPSQNVSKITVSTTPSPSSITSTSTTLMNTSNEMFVTKRNSFNMDFIDNQYDYEKYSDSDNSLNIKLHIAKQFLCDYGPRLQQNYDLWQKNFDFDNEKIKDNPMQWSITEVAKFIERHLNCAETAGVFKHECIDGTALLMLHQNDLTDNLGLKLGPSVRLYAYIIQLRTLAVTKFNVCYPITTNSK